MTDSKREAILKLIHKLGWEEDGRSGAFYCNVCGNDNEEGHAPACPKQYTEREIVKVLDACETLCRIYFEIAEEAIGEAQVREKVKNRLGEGK